jgi:hypothetical protein
MSRKEGMILRKDVKEGGKNMKEGRKEYVKE